jgi:two-component system, OmpR family, phosphate regulon sensor histidine kinase PhoR
MKSATRKPLSQIKQLFKEQHILMMLLKEFRDGILICDSQGAILQINQSLRHFLHLGQDVTGQQASDVIHNEQFSQALDIVLETGASHVEEITLERGSSHELFFEVHLVPIFMHASTVSELPEMDLNDAERGNQGTEACVIIFHDITDIRQTEKMRRDFVANVSHELRTPLSAIEGYSETLLDGALEDQSVCRDFINVIYRHSLRLTQLVEDLLDLSKLESPDFRPELAPFSLPGLVQQVIGLVGTKAEDKEIRIDVQIHEPLSQVLAEMSSMQQVLTNLLDNAIKYTPPQGRVVVSAFDNGKGKIQVDVSDTGIGIEAKYLPRIFERFYRVDKARSRDLGGTGLGLSIVKHIVQLHGGEIWVESTVNQGSTFSFTLDPATQTA